MPELCVGLSKLQECNISIDSVSTCSMGTILGGLLCAGLDIKKMEEAALAFTYATLKKKNDCFLLESAWRQLSTSKAWWILENDFW